MHVICRFLGHRRSKRKRVRHGYEWHSICIWCRKPMVRAGWKQWRLLGQERTKAA